MKRARAERSPLTKQQKVTLVTEEINDKNMSRATSADTYRSLLEKTFQTDEARVKAGPALKMWLSFHSSGSKIKNETSEVGEELSPANLEKNLKAFRAYQKALPKPKSDSTIANVVVIIRKLGAKSAELTVPSGAGLNFANLPEDFNEAFAQCLLIKNTALGKGPSKDRVKFSNDCAAAGVKKPITMTLDYWAKDRVPQTTSKVDFAKLEVAFGVPPGTFTTRLEAKQRLLLKGKSAKGQRSAYGQTLSDMMKSAPEPFPFDSWPDSAKKEWRDYAKYKTDDVPELKRQDKGVWRVKKGNICPTRDIARNDIGGYYAFLIAAGLVKKEDVSFACFSVRSLVDAYIADKRERRGGEKTSGDSPLPMRVAEYNHEETGWITQNEATFRAKVQGFNVTPIQNWKEHCKSVKDYAKGIKKVAMNSPKSRDNEPIENILSAQNPIEYLFELNQGMRVHVSWRRRMGASGETLAVLIRNQLLLQMLSVNPLRINNYRMMTYRKDNRGNLYQRPDKTWALRFNPEDFKNQKGAADRPYDTAITIEDPSLFDEYLSVRHHLKGSKGNDRVFVTPESDVVQFNPLITGLTRAILSSVTKQGFGPHAFRHIIATGYIKTHPNGYQVVAGILHDRLTTVLNEYAHLQSADHFENHWLPEVGEMRKKWKSSK